MESCQLAQTGSLTFIRLNLRKINPVFVTSNAAFFFLFTGLLHCEVLGSSEVNFKKREKSSQANYFI